jgi:heavy metal sensor kinase
MTRSIRLRLLLWYAAVLAAVVGGFAALLYYEVRSARLREIDAQIDAAAAGLESALRLFPQYELTGEDPPPPPRPRPDKGPPDKGFDKGPFDKGPPDKGFFERGPKGKKGPPDKGKKGPLDEGGPPGKGPPKGPPERMEPPEPPSRDRLLAGLALPGPPESTSSLYFAVWRADGRMLKSVGLPPDVPTPAPSPGSPAFWFRGSNRELTIRGPQGSIILVGRPAEHLAEGLRTFAWQLAGTGAAVLALGLAGGWLISRRILRPVAAISATASKISADNLSERIDADALDAELVELARVLNEAFDRLQEAFERQTRFTADASHELRTPLAVLRSQAELTLSRPRSADEYRKAVETCLRAAERMTGLVERLLALARADAGAAALHREPVDLGRVVSETVAQFGPLAEQKGVTLSASVAPAVVTGDAAALGQVAANLISNAIEYNRPGGHVGVRVTADVDEVTLTVTDTGVGIPPEHRPYIFERFYRVDKARSRAAGGSGLGLAICKAIVEAYGGTIGFDSALGEGSTFWVRLPRPETDGD